MIKYSHKIIARYSETDMMQRIHHSNYLIWLEESRIGLLNHIGLSYKKLELSGFFIPVISVNIKYMRPAVFNDQLSIEIFLKSKPKARFSFYYVINKDSQIIAEAHTEHAFVDKNNKVIKPPSIFNNSIKNNWKS